MQVFRNFSRLPAALAALTLHLPRQEEARRARVLPRWPGPITVAARVDI